MKKLLLAFIVCVFTIQADTIESDNQDTKPQFPIQNQPSTPQPHVPQNDTTDWIFVGFGLGHIYTYTNPKILDFYPAPTGIFILGGEWKFKNGNGLNISVDTDLTQNISFAFRYIYETPNTSWKYALLSGLSIGALGETPKIKGSLPKEATSISYASSVFMNYELGLRLRKNRHAVLLNIKVPLFSNDVNINYRYKVWLSSSRWDYNYVNEIVKQKMYPFAFSLSYIYFFGI